MTVKDHGNAGNKCSIQFKNGSHAQEQSVCGCFFMERVVFYFKKDRKGFMNMKYKRREEMGVINMKGVAKGGVKRKNSAETRLRVRREKRDLKGKSGQVLF